MYKTYSASIIIGLSALCFVKSGAMAEGTEPFRVTAQPIIVGKRLKVKLSVTNVSQQKQTFWTESGYCTNYRWKTDDPNIHPRDYSPANAKTCMTACEHKIIMRPGETLSWTSSPLMKRKTRLGKRVIRFMNLQPNIALTDGSRLESNRKYPPRIYSSNPMTLTIRKEWLTMSLRLNPADSIGSTNTVLSHSGFCPSAAIRRGTRRVSEILID